MGSAKECDWKHDDTGLFNVPNLKRFDVQTVTTDISSTSFGTYSGLLTNPRVMEFALRYEF